VPHRERLQVWVVRQLAEQLTLVAIALDRPPVFHAALILFLLLASLGAGLIRTVEVTSHCLSPR